VGRTTVVNLPWGGHSGAYRLRTLLKIAALARVEDCLARTTVLLPPRRPSCISNVAVSLPATTPQHLATQFIPVVLLICLAPHALPLLPPAPHISILHAGPSAAIIVAVHRSNLMRRPQRPRYRRTIYHSSYLGVLLSRFAFSTNMVSSFYMEVIVKFSPPISSFPTSFGRRRGFAGRGLNHRARHAYCLLIAYLTCAELFDAPRRPSTRRQLPLSTVQHHGISCLHLNHRPASATSRATRASVLSDISTLRNRNGARTDGRALEHRT